MTDLSKVLELQPGNKLAARDLAVARDALAKQAADAGENGVSPSSPGKKLKIVEVDQTSSSEEDNGEDQVAMSLKCSLVRKLAEIDVRLSF